MTKALLIIPAIDLSDGHCARCVLGEPGTENLYRGMSNNPVQMAQLWRRENAKCIHVRDNDSFSGTDNTASVKAAIAMQQAVDIPIQFVSLQYDSAVLRHLLDSGVYRVAVNALIVTDPQEVQRLVTEYGNNRVALGIRAENGFVHFRDAASVEDQHLIRQAYTLGIRRVIYGEKKWEGALAGQDPAVIERVASAAPVRYTMAGGIANSEQLWELQRIAPQNVDSVVIGRALYENRFPCQQIWRSAEAVLEPDLQNQLEDGRQSSISKLDKTAGTQRSDQPPT